MFVRSPVSAIAFAGVVFASSASTALAADAVPTTPVKITIPIQLAYIDAKYTTLAVQCFLTKATVAEATSSITSAFGAGGTMTQEVDVPIKPGAAFSTSTFVVFDVPSASLANYNAYVCSMGAFVSAGATTSPNAIPSAVGTVRTTRVIGSLH